MAESLERLLTYCRENGRVCPMPQQWHRLWDMLPEKSCRGVGWEPSLPLILAAWWEASDEEKKERLEAHLRWASDHGVVDQVAEFLRSLTESEWHHRDD
jgi:glycine/D-amino acid oxidase-like deaminating enzyme